VLTSSIQDDARKETPLKTGAGGAEKKGVLY